MAQGSVGKVLDLVTQRDTSRLVSGYQTFISNIQLWILFTACDTFRTRVEPVKQMAFFAFSKQEEACDF